VSGRIASKSADDGHLGVQIGMAGQGVSCRDRHGERDAGFWSQSFPAEGIAPRTGITPKPVGIACGRLGRAGSPAGRQAWWTAETSPWPARQSDATKVRGQMVVGRVGCPGEREAPNSRQGLLMKKKTRSSALRPGWRGGGKAGPYRRSGQPRSRRLGCSEPEGGVEAFLSLADSSITGCQRAGGAEGKAMVIGSSFEITWPRARPAGAVALPRVQPIPRQGAPLGPVESLSWPGRW